MAEVIAGITVPDTGLVRSATELVLDVDHELLYVGALFHDLGLTDKYGTDKLRFEVDGANAAKAFLLDHGRSEADAAKVWTAVALHTTRRARIHGSGNRAGDRRRGDRRAGHRLPGP